ncbi:PaaI family thioesterase [Variovorax saccharolyticus]|uniref:PaaI family thioesterase n=1 Tax=Variovorax saccharolyticus TaxID=3053516 RepID=UPI0025766293|nr:PaaI family thioesterase [Variovorax sp. J22R187]MDM0021074.1 PaaI family thioesterase [Variovorax sp. J22R187]
MKPAAADERRNVFGRVPFMRLLGARREFSAAGRARLVIDERAELGNVIGALHGGVVVTLLDVVMASAAVSLFDFERTAVTLNLNTSFLQPGRGALTADGEVLRHDDSVAWCCARVTDAGGSVVAQAQGSFRYLPLPPAD